MSSEVEITVRVMTPHKGNEPHYTAEKFLEIGELCDESFQQELTRNFHILLARAVNAVMLHKIETAEQSAAKAREQDAAEYRAEFR